MSTAEPAYTMAEARRLIEVQECAEGGHRPETVINADWEPVRWMCRCCSVRWDRHAQ